MNRIRDGYPLLLNLRCLCLSTSQPVFVALIPPASAPIFSISQIPHSPASFRSPLLMVRTARPHVMLLLLQLAAPYPQVIASCRILSERGRTLQLCLYGAHYVEATSVAEQRYGNQYYLKAEHDEHSPFSTQSFLRLSYILPIGLMRVFAIVLYDHSWPCQLPRMIAEEFLP